MPLRAARISLFFKDPPTTYICTLSLHDALPIWFLEAEDCLRTITAVQALGAEVTRKGPGHYRIAGAGDAVVRSEEHTSELQSRLHLVCRLLLEKKKTPLPPAHPTRRIELAARLD